ncbi:MAG: purine-nucleoside/S-methyl-5-thioadenosine phosphorylase / adenosine deaminase [Solirubrobacterales bacterium]|jgi:YfiH family protein|nr:purine-nucleoside/S-methyl-5-thioadenosine phosphorylase / adenosine deaminase [Solirubrobacterales bacterium]
MEWREAGGVRWQEARMPGATAAFTTRVGGVSEPPFDELNLGIFTDDGRDAVVENRRHLAAALGFTPDRVAIAHQVHGAELIAHASSSLRCSFASSEGDKAQRGKGEGGIPDADGHVVAEAGVAALVFVADCVPVTLAGPGGAAILHCGWRGLAAGIIARGVEAIGASDAAIGPSIGPCCYEVGEDVLDAFAGLGDGIASGRMLDLSEVARRLLREQGVERVETSGLCTSCEPGLFFSHRRDAGRTGRQAGLVWLERESG